MQANSTVRTEDTIQFRLCGEHMSISMTDFNLLLGLFDDAHVAAGSDLSDLVDYPNEFDASEFYAQISIDPNPYNPRLSKANTLHDPVHRLFQRFLAFNFSGRQDNSNVLAKIELFFIWCAEYDTRVNMGHFLLTQLKYIVTQLKTRKKTLILGSLITLIAERACGLPESNPLLTKLNSVEVLDFRALQRMQILRPVASGDQYAFLPAEAALRDVLPPPLTLDSERLERMEARQLRMEAQQNDMANVLHSLVNTVRRIDRYIDQSSELPRRSDD